ncbi:MAG: hypothetical protein AB8H86_32825 [Polyangiales bacterium]
MHSFEAENGDYASMSDFGLRDRWTEAKHTLLSASQLARIRPLNPSMTSEAWRFSLALRQPESKDGRPADSLYANIESLNVEQGDVGTEWLQRRIGHEGSPIIVCWNAFWAVETDARLFAQYWDSFCYPSSDDVAIFPLHCEWLVTYWHEEHLFFGRRR